MSAPLCPDYGKIHRELDAKRLAEYNLPVNRRLRVARVLILVILFPLPLLYGLAIFIFWLVNWLATGET
jgi:hypothetical protein